MRMHRLKFSRNEWGKIAEALSARACVFMGREEQIRFYLSETIIRRLKLDEQKEESNKDSKKTSKCEPQKREVAA